ncbi:MAG TPA: ATP-binding protein, partial [Labilithrix sp.]
MVDRERIRVLLVEDSADDAALVLRELARAGFDVHHERVEEAGALRTALSREWQIILCDYTMPQLDAPTALRVVREVDQDVPVIVVSGTVGEEIAVQVMRFGASDYLLKDNLRRLGPAVTRELREIRVRKDKRRHEEARRAAEESFRLIIERSPELVIVHREGNVVYANPTALARLGYRSAKELEGRSMDSIVGHASQPSGREQSWLRSDGATVTVEVERQTTTFDGETAVVEVARDVTERNELTAAMMEIDRMAAIGVLAAGVAHEINNPLAYVLANLEYVSGAVDELLAANHETERYADLRQALSDMDHGAKRVRDIVQDIRTFSRVSDANVAPVDVRQVLDSSVRMASVQIRPRAKLVRRYEDVPNVLANESRLGQVFLNLVTNAAQAVPDGKIDTNRITLETRFEDGKVVVSVGDTGVGIPPDALPRLFQPFFTTKPAGHGTGLGLAISRRIVEALGGSIEVTSNPGQGTTFTVRLPPAT